jgi:hypothetical protein
MFSEKVMHYYGLAKDEFDAKEKANPQGVKKFEFKPIDSEPT